MNKKICIFTILTVGSGCFTYMYFYNNPNINSSPPLSPPPLSPPPLSPPPLYNLKCIGCFGNPCSFCHNYLTGDIIYTSECCNNCMGCIFENSNIQPPGLFGPVLSHPPHPLPAVSPPK